MLNSRPPAQESPLQVRRLTREVSCGGYGLHTGTPTSLTFIPSEAPGIFFLKGEARIAASLESVSDTRRGVTLGAAPAQVKTVEHLLAALRWLGIASLQIKVEGEEIPVMDGSSLPWIRMLEPLLSDTGEAFPGRPLAETLVVEGPDSWIKASPSDSLRVNYAIDFPGTPVGEQRWEGKINPVAFIHELAPARTFGFVEEVELLRKQGLARGGNLETCVVITKDLILTPLRFKEEMIRHKVLDLLGDLALLSWIPAAKIEAYKASHALHARLAAKLAGRD